MKEFLLVFRRDFVTNEAQPSPEQMQGMMKHWQDWMGGIAAQNKLVSSGNRLSSEGRVVKPNNVVTKGPYAEIAEAIGVILLSVQTQLTKQQRCRKVAPFYKLVVMWK